LVLKTDNGPGFVGQVTGRSLAALSILHLRSPPATPQYDGSCEAAGGTQKKPANNQASLARPLGQRGSRTDPSDL